MGVALVGNTGSTPYIVNATGRWPVSGMSAEAMMNLMAQQGALVTEWRIGQFAFDLGATSNLLALLALIAVPAILGYLAASKIFR